MNPKRNHSEILPGLMSRDLRSAPSLCKSSSSMVPAYRIVALRNQEALPPGEGASLPGSSGRLLNDADFRTLTGFARERRRTVMSRPSVVDAGLTVFLSEARKGICGGYLASLDMEEGDEAQIQ